MKQYELQLERIDKRITSGKEAHLKGQFTLKCKGGTSFVVLKHSKTVMFEKLDSKVSFQKLWPLYSRNSLIIFLCKQLYIGTFLCLTLQKDNMHLSTRQLVAAQDVNINFLQLICLVLSCFPVPVYSLNLSNPQLSGSGQLQIFLNFK